MEMVRLGGEFKVKCGRFPSKLKNFNFIRWDASLKVLQKIFFGGARLTIIMKMDWDKSIQTDYIYNF